MQRFPNRCAAYLHLPAQFALIQAVAWPQFSGKDRLNQCLRDVFTEGGSFDTEYGFACPHPFNTTKVAGKMPQCIVLALSDKALGQLRSTLQSFPDWIDTSIAADGASCGP